LLLSLPWLRPIKRAAATVLPRYREFDALCQKQYGSPPADRPGRLVVAISRMVERDLQRHHAMPASQIRLVYNGVDSKRFTPDLRAHHRDKVRMELSVRPEQVLYLIVAHNFVLKGVPALLEATTLLCSAGHDAVLVIV